MRRIGMFGFLVLAAAACTTVGFVGAMRPTRVDAFLAFSAWLISPYAAMAAVLALLERKGAAAARWHVVAIVVSIGGVLFLADLIFWHTDAQGALAVLMAPLFQGAALAVLIPLTWLAARRTHKRQP